ncbi:hypothetical protein, partial [Brevundimonas sp.]|uniref:hypothetical protein n=1 Tax=Brevundimonas sp. TaxID=1871086 RepID=UPI00289B863F
EPRDPKAPAKRLRVQKSNSSHAKEALQYAMLGDQGRAGVVAGQAFDQHRPKSTYGGGQGDGWAASPGGVLMPQTGGGGASYSSDWSPWDS